MLKSKIRKTSYGKALGPLDLHVFPERKFNRSQS